MWILMLGCKKLGSHPLLGSPFSKSRNCYVIFTSTMWLPSPLTESQHFFLYCPPPVLKGHLKQNHSNKTENYLSSKFNPFLSPEINVSSILEQVFIH